MRGRGGKKSGRGSVGRTQSMVNFPKKSLPSRGMPFDSQYYLKKELPELPSKSKSKPKPKPKPKPKKSVGGKRKVVSSKIRKLKIIGVGKKKAPPMPNGGGKGGKRKGPAMPKGKPKLSEKDREWAVNRRETKKIEKIIEKKTNLVEEFIETEKGYVEQLCTFKKFYIDKIKEKVGQGKEEIFSKSEVTMLFAHYEIIIPINQMFIKDIRRKGKIIYKNIVPFCDVVCQFSHCFKLYSAYMAQYGEIAKFVKEKRGTNENFKALLVTGREELSKINFRIKDFFSFLLLPIQRIPRYKMLLESLLKQLKKLSVQNQEVKKVEQAFEVISKITTYVNNQSKMGKLDVKMKELDQILNVKGLVQPHRKLLREIDNLKGSYYYYQFTVNFPQLKKKKKETFKKFECRLFLFSDILCCLFVKKINLLVKTIDQKRTIAVFLNKSLRLSRVIIDPEAEDSVARLRKEDKKMKRMSISKGIKGIIPRRSFKVKKSNGWIKKQLSKEEKEINKEKAAKKKADALKRKKELLEKKKKDEEEKKKVMEETGEVEYYPLHFTHEDDPLFRFTIFFHEKTHRNEISTLILDQIKGSKDTIKTEVELVPNEKVKTGIGKLNPF